MMASVEELYKSFSTLADSKESEEKVNDVNNSVVWYYRSLPVA